MKKEEKDKLDLADPLTTNSFGFIIGIFERWKIDGRNIFRSFRGYLTHPLLTLNDQCRKNSKIKKSKGKNAEMQRQH